MSELKLRNIDSNLSKSDLDKRLNKKIKLKSLEDNREIFDALYPTIEKNLNSSVKNRIIKEIVRINDANSEVLNTNIIGRQLYINKDKQNVFINTVGLREREVELSVKNNTYLNTIKKDMKLSQQIIHIAPILLGVKHLIENKDIDTAKFLFTFCFYKPYASIISHNFKYDVNEERMIYTIENLDKKFDIKKEETSTLITLLYKKAEMSFNNYYDALLRATDKDIYEICTSGINTRIQGFVKGIMSAYMKNAGKVMFFETESRKEDDYRLTTNDSMEKSRIATTTLNRVISEPLDLRAMNLAARHGGKGISLKVLQNNIEVLIQKKYKELYEFIESILAAYLVEGKGQIDKIKSEFLINAINNYSKSPNSKGNNIVRMKTLLTELLQEVSETYNKAEDPNSSSILNLKRAIYWYFVLLIRKSA